MTEKTKVSWWRFYILYPLYCLFNWIRSGYRAATKRWYCAGCSKYHSGRVIRYSPIGEDCFCYRHMTNKDIQSCVVITIGNHVITARVARAIQEECKRLWDPLRRALQGQAHPRQVPFDLIQAPTETQAREAAGVLGDYCRGRLQVECCGTCDGCPVRYVCNDPPYAWPEYKKSDGGITYAEEAPQRENVYPGNGTDGV